MQELPSLKETVEKYQLLAKKSLGQNFLLDTNITEKIIRCRRLHHRRTRRKNVDPVASRIHTKGKTEFLFPFLHP